MVLWVGLLCAAVSLASGTSQGFEAVTEQLPEASDNRVEVASGPYWGVEVGRLDDPQATGVQGTVYVVNDTCLQILNFTYNGDAPDLYFWADRGSALSSSGVRLGSFEFGEAALGAYDNTRVVVLFPDHVKLSDFRSFGLWCQAFAKNFGQVAFPIDLQPPKPEFLEGVIDGKRYGVGSGPVLVMDRKTLKVYGFTFNGQAAPDGYFYVGRGPKPKSNNGVKVAIRGRDSAGDIRPMKENFKGKEDLILELPDGYDVHNIDWLSVYCVQFRVDFGHIRVGQRSPSVPPHVPPQERKDAQPLAEGWPATTLLGRPSNRRNFTFHIGPPGGSRGYSALARAKANDYVWYVDGYLAPELWLQRGVEYTLVVEGGDDASSEFFHNPLYISDEPFGGYAKLTPDERAQVRVFAGLDSSGQPISEAGQSAAGRLCLWQAPVNDDPEAYEDFPAYRSSLQLSCRPGQPGLLRFTPDEATPDLLYYQSARHYNMGWKLMVVDEIPGGLPDSQAQPFSTQLWLDQNLVTNVPASPSLYSAGRSAALSPLPLLLLLATLLPALLHALR